MVDIKVLAAVLVSLAAFGIVSDGGVQSLNTPSNPLSDGFGGIQDIGPRSLGAFLGIVETDTNTEKISAEFSYNISEQQKIAFETGNIEVEGLEELKLKNGKITSENSLRFHNATGETVFSPKTTLTGKSESINTNGVNITGPHNFDEKAESQKVSFIGIKSEEIKLNGLKGEINSGSTTSNLREETQVSIEDFNGNIVIRPYIGELSINGSVNKLEAGKVYID